VSHPPEEFEPRPEFDPPTQPLPPYGAWAPPPLPPAPGQYSAVPPPVPPRYTFGPPQSGTPAAPYPAWMPPTPPQRARIPWLPIVVVTLLVGAVGGVLGTTGVLVAAGKFGGGGSSTSPPVPPVRVHPTGSVPGRVGGSPIVTVAHRVLPSVVSIDVQSATVHVSGSGFVYDSRGHIVTNNHVVEPAIGGGRISVTFADGRQASASIVGRSPSYDLAVLSVDAGGVPPVSVGDSDLARVGQTVVAFGSPLGLDSTVTSGILSATERPVTAGGHGETSYIDALQTDAAINPGNSGGPLVDLVGRVIGVNSALATVGRSSGTAGNIGVGFAIPIDQVRTTVAQILQTGHAQYPVIGVQVNVAPAYAGARIEQVPAGSPARRAGLQVGDVVTAVDGHPVHNGIDLIVLIRSYRPGDVVTLQVRRDGGIHPVRVRLGRKVG
jgi:putative serine protease PepD